MTNSSHHHYIIWDAFHRDKHFPVQTLPWHWSTTSVSLVNLWEIVAVKVSISRQGDELEISTDQFQLGQKISWNLSFPGSQNWYNNDDSFFKYKLDIVELLLLLLFERNIWTQNKRKALRNYVKNFAITFTKENISSYRFQFVHKGEIWRNISKMLVDGITSLARIVPQSPVLTENEIENINWLL